jgi:hypothetical protein
LWLFCRANSGDLFWKIDLRKAYHQVMILEKLRKFLRSQWIDLTPPRTIRRIQQRTLAQGFGPAGLILGKQLKPLLQMLRAMGIRVCLATDDLIGAVSTTEQGFKEMFITVRLLVTELGGILSPEKCIFNLPQTIEWYGMRYCSVTSTTMMPASKVIKAVQAVMRFKVYIDSQRQVTIRQVEQIKGLLMSMAAGVDEARLMVSGFQELLRHMMTRDTLNTNGIARDKPLSVSMIPVGIITHVRANLQEWIGDFNQVSNAEMISWNGRYHHCGHPMATIFTDACEWQKGVLVYANKDFPEISRQIPMNRMDADQHITHSETDASTDGVIETVLERDLYDGCIALCVDASSAMPYQQNKGGRIQALSDKMRTQTKLLRERRLTALVYHVQGVKNPADKPSRDLVGAAEYMLAPEIFDLMNKTWGPFTIDAFAAKWNKQMDPYICFQRSDSEAVGFDFMSQPLDKIQGYQLHGTIWMFPPPHPNIITEIMRRVQLQELEVVVIIPLWQTAYIGMAWPMLIDTPNLIAVTRKSLLPPTGYQRWNKSKYESVTHMLTSKTWKSLVGLRLSGASKSRGVWIRNWRKRYELFTNPERAKKQASIFKAHGHCYSPNSEGFTEAAKSLSQMLNCAM